MSTEVFQNSYTVSDAWSAAGASLTFKKSDGDNVNYTLLLENIQFTYQRRTSQLYPISTDGKKRKITLVGEPSGSLTCSGIIGPSTSIKALLEATAKTCYTGENAGCTCIIRPFTSECSNGTTKTSASSLTYRLSGVIMNAITLTIQGGETAYVRQPITFEFTGLKVS